MIQISIRALLGANRQFAAGATLGREHFREIVAALAKTPATNVETLAVFDFADVDDVSASYIKATLLAAHRCGRLHAGVLSAEELRDSSVELQALPIVVVVARASDDVAECINAAFGVNDQAVLAGTRLKGDRLSDGVVLGALEAKAQRTLALAAAYPEVTATELLADHPEEGISGATGWNNRLAELHRLQLLRRRTVGRQHTYYPLATEIKTYGKVLHRK